MSTRFVAAAAAAVLAFAASAAAASTSAGNSPELSLDEQMGLAFEHAEAERCDQALPLLHQGFKHPEFKRKPLAAQGVAFELAGVCELASGRIDAAIALLTKADKTAGLHEFSLPGLTLGAFILNDQQRAVGALERIQDPETLKAFTDEIVFDLVRGVRKNQPLRRRLLAALHRLDFKPTEPFNSFDWSWADYARLVQPTDPAAAARAAAKVTNPGILLELRLDARFAAQADADPGRFELRAAAERQLAADRAIMAAHPDLLEGPKMVANDLRTLGRAEEALALLDAALARKEPWKDPEDQLNWVRNERAWILRDLGRHAEAEAAMREAAGTSENGQPNVSQTINLSELLLSVNRPEEALTVLKPFDADMPVSEYGEMWVAASRACAYAALDRKPELRKTLAWMAAHEEDNPSAHTRARLCANDLDGAAASYLRRLADPDQRSEALVALSDFDPPAAVAPGTQALVARWEQVRVRPDVRAAVAKVGRTERVPLTSTYWGDV